MKAIERFLGKSAIMGDLLKFFWERKLWWLIPMLLVLLVMGILIIFAQSTSVVPFIYVLF